MTHRARMKLAELVGTVSAQLEIRKCHVSALYTLPMPPEHTDAYDRCLAERRTAVQELQNTFHIWRKLTAFCKEVRYGYE